MALEKTRGKTKVIIGVVLFAIFSILFLNFLGIDMYIEDNKGFSVLQRKAIYEGIANKQSRKSQRIE